MKSIFFLTIGSLALLAPGTGALAGCDPSCSDGEVCRYESAGDKYYCAKSKGAKGAVIQNGDGPALSPKATPGQLSKPLKVK